MAHLKRGKVGNVCLRGKVREKNVNFFSQSYLTITSSISEIKIQLNSTGYMYKTILFVPNI